MVHGVLVLDEDVEAVERQRNQGEASGDLALNCARRHAVRGRDRVVDGGEGEGEQQHRRGDHVQLGFLGDEVAVGREAGLGDEPGEAGDDQDVEKGGADDGGDTELEIGVEGGGDDDRGELREARADGALDDVGQTVVGGQAFRRGLEQAAALPDDGGRGEGRECPEEDGVHAGISRPIADGRCRPWGGGDGAGRALGCRGASLAVQVCRVRKAGIEAPAVSRPAKPKPPARARACRSS